MNSTRAGNPADTLTVIFTAETRGNLEPCACPRGGQGGLARRVAYARAAAGAVRARGGTALVLDAGGFLPEGEVPLRNDPAVERRLTALLLEGLRLAGTQAVALDHGARAFLERNAPREARRLRAEFLEADPPSAPLLVEWGARRVAIVALEETLTDEVVRAAGSAARARGDLVIVLARGDAFSGRRLARLSGADLVVLSRGARPATPIVEAGSILVGCGTDGREVGEVRIVLDAQADGRADGRYLAPRVTEFRLHGMVEATQKDLEVERGVEGLVRDAGPRAFVRVSD